MDASPARNERRRAHDDKRLSGRRVAMSGAATALVVLLVSVAVPHVAPGAAESDYRAGVERQFKAWLVSLRREAETRGISRDIFQRALHGVKLDWELPGLHPPGRKPADEISHWQAEFRSPGAYFRQSHIDSLVAAGRRRLRDLEPLLTAIERAHGVPRGILLGVWAKETGYGRAGLPYNAVRTLATLGFMSGRREFFRSELLAALGIVRKGHIPAAGMKSAWSGAMGHPQFMPSVYLKHAVDQDGDGKSDIWSSVPDSLASIANFLKRSGWRGRDWGYEVVLPDGFDCTLEGPDKGRTIAEWAGLGVKRTFGRGFSARRLGQRGSMLLPAGTRGPAFVVLENFYVLKKYNESDLYALFVGHLADRYGKNRGFEGKWSAADGLTRGDTLDMQRRLVKRGHDVGGVDGLIGFRSRVSAGAYARSQGLKPTCYPDKALIGHLRKTTPL